MQKLFLVSNSYQCQPLVLLNEESINIKRNISSSYPSYFILLCLWILPNMFLNDISIFIEKQLKMNNNNFYKYSLSFFVIFFNLFIMNYLFNSGKILSLILSVLLIYTSLHNKNILLLIFEKYTEQYSIIKKYKNQFFSLFLMFTIVLLSIIYKIFISILSYVIFIVMLSVFIYYLYNKQDINKLQSDALGKLDAFLDALINTNLCLNLT